MLQLELNLWDQIREAESTPTAVDFRQLCLSFDAEMQRLSAQERLESGAEAIAQLADILAMRAESYFEEWQQRFDPVGPMLETDDFADLVRQSFSLDLDDLIAEPEERYRLPSEDKDEGGSSVSEMPKEDLLELLEDSEVGNLNFSIDELEHSEDIGTWIDVVRSWLEMTGVGQAEFYEVIKGTKLNPVVVWMTWLLGGFLLEKQGDFYLGDVIIAEYIPDNLD